MQRMQLILMRIDGPARPRTVPLRKTMMKASARVLRGPRRAWLPGMLIAAVILALVLLAAVACSGPPPAGSGGSPAAGGSAAAPSAVAYSHCMRSRGVPNYPDPPSGGQVPKADRAATGGQQRPAPGGPEILPAPVPGQRRGARRLAAAMRGNRQLPAGHGAPGDEQHAGVFPVHARPWGAELARPHRRFPGPPWFQSRPDTRHRLEFAAGPERDLRMRAPDALRRRGSRDLPRRARLNSGAGKSVSPSDHPGSPACCIAPDETAPEMADTGATSGTCV